MKMQNENVCHVETILDSFKFERLGKIKPEVPFILPQETINERVKLERQKTGTRIKIVTSNKIITRLPVKA